MKLMKVVVKIMFFLFFALLLVYVSFPSPGFPEPMEGFFQSGEPADVETPLRRGYYTNATRQEVMDYYVTLFKGYRLNYPPEEAQTIIRDQTKSTFLEEIVHPLRESVYINGFEPDSPEYEIVINGIPWRQKVIVRYVPSGLAVRMIVVCLSVIAVCFLLRKKEPK